MPSRTSMRSFCTRIRWWRKWTLYTLIIIYGVIPAFVLLFPGIVSYTALSFSLPVIFSSLNDPSRSGMEAARHLFVKTNSGDTLGLWHILPESALQEKKPIPEDAYLSRLASGAPIFIYAHGSGGNRAQFTRVYTYTALRGQDWHIITFDYRGFGDSTGGASEANMVEDMITVYRWVRQHAGSSPVFLWGHSMGSGVVTHAARLLSSQNETPEAIVLEAPFNNLLDLSASNLLLLPYWPFPFIQGIFLNALKQESLLFTSDQHLPHVRCPTLILHAEDDRIVPIHFGRKLFHSVITARQQQQEKDQPPVVMHAFPGNRGFGHNRISQAPDLGSIVWNFVQETMGKKAETKSL